MERNALADLDAWKSSPRRKPLLVYGARQVGKTYLIKEFGSRRFADVAYFDLEAQADAREAFSGNLDPRTIVSNLSQVAGRAIDMEKTLVVFDEIQASNRALASLKYFYEDLPQAHVVAAGSLLGVAVNREGYSAPVGKVDTLTLSPMTFDEYLKAAGQAMMIDGIRDSFDSGEPYFLHERALDLYRSYVLVGGLPEAVSAYLETESYESVRTVHRTIAELYIADMAKYAQPYETARIMEAWRSVPSQLAKENKKFQYKMVHSGGRASQYEGALAWLQAAGLIERCVQVTSGQVPLAAQENRGAFKVYLSDTGLLSTLMGVRPQMLFDEQARAKIDAGALTENYVAQALAANGFDLRYWVSQGKAEVDFVIETGAAKAVPLEVKSSHNVRSKSLSVYREKYRPDQSIRLSVKNFGYDGAARSVPLYAAFRIGKD